ncbi:MAG: NAD(P)(+) transhydrogenase (Re/Si-specific) subunit beta, partial [Candidatus Aminicenantes bacterium]|nr:NAD(P)(+) transhydrogenase (Re/Si-specific) subunit beta [Candidatus Aminicenantes bacterium]
MAVIKDISYLIAASLFILGMKKLSSPKTARFGNFLSMLGMLIAVVATLFDKQILDFTFIIAGLVIGTFIGTIVAKKIEMTSMPQMVALFNSFGGGASALVAFAQFMRFRQDNTAFVISTIVVSVLIGTVTFTGSVIAFARLQGIMRGAPIVFKGQKPLNFLVFAAAVVLSVLLVLGHSPLLIMLLILFLSCLFGILAVLPIGGADMPVVISLLNSFSGLAAAAAGFVLSSSMLIIAGSLVGASGIILTNIMCKAMNRPLSNVLFGAVGSDGAPAAKGEKRQVTDYAAEDAGMMLESAQSVIIVPGYGLAVAQAQHVLHELQTLLQ